jgi:hypothetical protein
MTQAGRRRRFHLTPDCVADPNVLELVAPGVLDLPSEGR